MTPLFPMALTPSPADFASLSGLGAMFALLALGFGMGLRHAFEADHMAAVSTIAARERSFARLVLHGAFWGIGHTLTLMLVAGAVMVFGLVISARMSHWLEGMVGVMLVGLGANLLWRLWRDRIHAHRHRHDDGEGHSHWHFHSHKGETAPHHASAHSHAHGLRALPMRTLMVGMMHGLAGSGALLLLTAATVSSPLLGLGYILIFGLGSILGMMSLSALLAVPLAWSARTLTWANRTLQAMIGLATLGLGVVTIYSNLLVV